ncbi:MAG: RDD family protein, partial [Aquihabitans sp.]
VVPGVAAAVVFAANTTRSWSGASAGFAFAALATVVVLEVGVRAVRRASIGESVAHIGVEAAGGGRAGTGRLVVRWLAKPISAIPAFAGYWLPQRQADRRAWHDRIAGVEFHTETPPP